ncbi:MAG: SDR family oxidoreductase [Promethearchaeota archaeon]|nr:MAG: SDR family oxidoreductase [Candidatus Lokiarchaeota archaeon]
MNLKEKIILITGSTDGMGKQAALDLLKKGAHVIIHGRNKEKAENTANELKMDSKSEKIDYVWADFTRLDEVREMAKQVHQKADRIDILINNAGVYQTEKQITEEGLEYTFVINHLSHFLLTNLLLDIIKKGNASRIVNIASQVQLDSINFNNLNAEQRFSGTHAYALSKTCNIMFTYELAERLKDSGITVNCLHPGVINTKLLRQGFGPIGQPVEVGAENEIWVATSPELDNITGKYFKNRTAQRSSEVTYDQEARDKLWGISEKLTKINY